jgi:quinol monooxygenase YgiN
MSGSGPEVVVAGELRVEPAARDAYLAGCLAVIRAARHAEGCLDFHLSPDPVEPDRINVFEHWASEAAVEAFRGSGPPDDQAVAITSARVLQHEVAASAVL